MCERARDETPEVCQRRRADPSETNERVDEGLIVNERLWREKLFVGRCARDCDARGLDRVQLTLSEWMRPS